MNFGESKWIVNHERGRCAHHCMPAWFIHTKRNLNGLNVTGQSPQWYIGLISHYSKTRIIILVKAPLCQFTAWKYMIQSFLWSQLVVTKVWLLFLFLCRFDCWLGNGMGIRLGLGAMSVVALTSGEQALSLQSRKYSHDNGHQSHPRPHLLLEQLIYQWTFTYPNE